MKVLLLNAGAKDCGATQEILLAMQAELPEDSSFELLCLGNLNLGFCKGCKACYGIGECVQEDDVQRVLDAIDRAGRIVIAAPSYWADIPGQFKVFIDRCTPYSNTSPNPKRRTLKSGKRCYAIALRTGTRPAECRHIIDTVEHWCGHMGLTFSGSMFFCGVEGKEDLAPYREQIRKTANEWFSM